MKILVHTSLSCNGFFSFLSWQYSTFGSERERERESKREFVSETHSLLKVYCIKVGETKIILSRKEY